MTAITLHRLILLSNNQFNFLRLQVDNVSLRDKFNPNIHNNGTLHLTATHLIFINPIKQQEIWVNLSVMCSINVISIVLI